MYNAKSTVLFTPPYILVITSKTIVQNHTWPVSLKKGKNA
jgi:hypothetical protein